MNAVEFELGVVCGDCATYSPMGTERCPRCEHSLELGGAGPARLSGAFAAQTKRETARPRPRIFAPTRTSEERRSHTAQIDRISDNQNASGQKPSAEDELMDQAKNYVCESCMTPVPSGHKFCGRCGEPVPEDILHLRTDYFSDMQDPSKARVVLIRGQDMEGLSYHLKADQHLVGRGGALDFSDDPFVSEKHANFFYRAGRLVVRDEGSLNGVYFRVRGSVEISPGALFIAGEQVFRLDPTPKASDGNDPDGTEFYTSPIYDSNFRLNQMLEGGAVGMTVCARGSSLEVGREDGDLNFPGDLYMSAKHCRVEESGGKFRLVDHDSRNGTYIRLKAERELSHGDYLFIGKKLLRVELNSN